MTVQQWYSLAWAVFFLVCAVVILHAVTDWYVWWERLCWAIEERDEQQAAARSRAQHLKAQLIARHEQREYRRSA